MWVFTTSIGHALTLVSLAGGGIIPRFETRATANLLKQSVEISKSGFTMCPPMWKKAYVGFHDHNQRCPDLGPAGWGGINRHFETHATAYPFRWSVEISKSDFTTYPPTW